MVEESLRLRLAKPMVRLYDIHLFRRWWVHSIVAQDRNPSISPLVGTGSFS